jgi:hypothetical protein
MSLAGAQGLIGTAIGLAALGLALGFVSQSIRSASDEGRRKPRRGELGFGGGGGIFGGGNSGRGRSRRRSNSSMDDIFAPPRARRASKGRRRNQEAFF